MKYFFIILTSIVTFSCHKEKVPTPAKADFYQSDGNFLILKIGENLESIYEYNLASITLSNDSLPIYFENSINDTSSSTTWKFTPNSDTLFQFLTDHFTFFSGQILPIDLNASGNSIPFDFTKFQLITTQQNFDYETIWSKISNLEIVHEYRFANPTSKIGINHIVESKYDIQLGVTIPVEKYLVYLVK